MAPRADFHCITTWVALYSGRNSAMNLLILWFRVSSQMAVLFSINISFRLQDQTVPYSSWQTWKIYFAQESFCLQAILNDINEQDTSFLDCKHKHMMKSGAPLDKVRVLYYYL